MDVFGMLYNLLLAQKVPTGQGQQITLDAAPEGPNIHNIPENNTTPPVLDAAPAEKALGGFIITIPPKPAVGSPTNVTITAVDEVGNVFTGYTGTIFLDLVSQATTDMSTPLDENGYTFTSGDAGTHTFAQSFFFKKAGIYTFDILELDTPGDGVSQSVTVTAQ